MWNEESLKDAIQKVLAKASEDVEFRKLCVVNPKAAVLKVSGLEVPTDFPLRIVDPTNAIIFVLPKLKNDELTDSQLAAVAGGSKDGAKRFFFGVLDGVTTTVTFGIYSPHLTTDLDDPTGNFEGYMGYWCGGFIPGIITRIGQAIRA